MTGESGAIDNLTDQITQTREVVAQCDSTINNDSCCFNIMKIASKKNEDLLGELDDAVTLLNRSRDELMK